VPRSHRTALAARIGAPLAGLALLLAACGAAGPTTAPTAVPSGVVAVETREYVFTPSTINVPAGAVTFSVRNAGTEEHEFEVFKGETVVDEIEGLVPGLTKDLTLTLAAGDYTYMCKLNGHDQLGMKGTLTVTGG
jgi:iron uptake system component EfeO